MDLLSDDTLANNMEEAPRQKKCIETNFDLCLKCQIKTIELIRKNPKETSYQLFLDTVHQRADYGDAEFIAIWERLRDVTSDILKDKSAVWHSSCYSSTTNQTDLQRARQRYEKTIATKDGSQLKRKRGRPSTADIQTTSEESTTARHTRSKTPTFDREKCFFCQCQMFGHFLHRCSSINIGKQISDIIEKSDVPEWKVNYDVVCEDDALSRDIVYHKICMTRQWKKYCNTKHKVEEQDTGDTVRFIAAEIEFYSQLNENISSGKYVSIAAAVTDYTNIMKENGKTDITITRRKLKEHIKSNIENVEFTRPSDKSMPTLIHSTAAQTAAVDAAAHRNGNEEVQIIFHCAQIIRRAIEQAQAWKFTGSLKCPNVPAELDILLRWVVQGPSVPQTEMRADVIHRSCNNLAQQVMQAYKSKRQVTYKPKSPMAGFRNTTQTPLTTGMSLHCYRASRSKNMIDLLARAGFGASYWSTLEHVAQIAGEVQKNIVDNNGVYIPHGLKKSQTIYAAIDNIDANVDTPDGKDSFHALAATVFQKAAADGEDVRELVAPLQLSKQSATLKLKNLPLTGVELLPCRILGSPKPKESPHYPDFKRFQHEDKLVESEQCITAWLLARFFCRHTPAAIRGIVSPEASLQMQPNVSSIIDKHAVKPVVTEEATTGIEHEVVEIPDSTSKVTDATTQCIPVWAAYNSVINTEPTTNQQKPLDQSYALPLINAPAHEWQTLTTSLLQLHDLNELVGNDKPVCVWLDMDLYKRVLKLTYLDPSQYANKWIESPGQFHTVLCALRCLGKTVENSGLDQAWVQADIYSNVTVMQIINGKHYNRAIECHQVTLQVLTDLFLETVFQKNPRAYAALQDSTQNLAHACRQNGNVAQAQKELVSTMSALNIMKLVKECDATNDKYPVYKWARMYMRQVTTMLSFLQSTRQQQWDLHLASLEKLCIWFFAYNRLDYAQHVPEYIARMYHLQHEKPGVWLDFENGNFTVKTKSVAFTAIGVDQAQEHVNKRHKGDGGVSGITTNPEALMRYCLTTPELARLSTELEDMLGVTKFARSSHHHMTDSKVKRQEKYVSQLKTVLSDANPFTVGDFEDGTELKLFNVITKVILPEDVAENILGTESRGEKQYKLFVEERICGKKNLWEKMSKVKVLGWSAGCKPLQSTATLEQANLRASSSVMARLLVIARSSRELDMKEVIGTYELSTTNQMLMTADGRLHACQDKAQLIHQLEHLVALQTPASNPVLETPNPVIVIPDHTCIIFDAMAVVNELVVFKSVIKSCNDLAKAYVQAIDRKSQGYMCAYVVFDDYSVTSSLKDATRKRRTGGKAKQQPCYKVEDTTPIKDYGTFLSSTKTKDLLTVYLSQKVVEHSTVPVTTVTRQGVLSNQPSTDFVKLQSTHEEADTLLVLYAAEVHKSGVDIHIYCSDTDVLVLAVSTQPYLGSEATQIMGTGDKRRHVRLEPIYKALGKHKALALRGLHAISGCDTTGHIHGKSKLAWWNAFLTASNKVINALSALGIEDEPSEMILTGCEELVCQLFNTKRTKHTRANDLRWSHFVSLKANQGTEKLPPTQGAINEHTRRAHLQCRTWQQVLVAKPLTLEATSPGWSQGPHGELMPVLSRLPPAPESLVQLVKCSCQKSQCRGRCSCRVNNVKCTELCKCEASHEACTNIEEVVNDTDSDSENEVDDA